MTAVRERRGRAAAGRRSILWRAWQHSWTKTLFPFAVIVAAWGLVARFEIFPSAFFTGPDAVLAKFGELIRKGVLPEYLADSTVRLASGAALGLAAGIPMGYLIGLNRHVRRTSWPLLLFFQAIADIAWLPILIIWFGFSLTSVTFVIVYSVIFPLVVSIVAGIDGIPEDLVRAARCLGASRRQVLFEVVLPGSFAAAAMGIRTGLGYGWRALIAAEIIVGTSGIGFMMFDARRAGQVTEVFVGMIVLGVLWYAVDALILAPLERETVERWGLVRRVGRPV
jgi:NitT/TauT family transport system permease protein/taurine transport system permease protein